MRKLVIDMKKRWAKGLITGLVMIFIILTIVFIVKSVRDSKIEIRCPDTIVVEYGSDFDESVIKTATKKHLFDEKDKTDIEIEGDVDVTKLGKYEIKVVASRKKKLVSKNVVVDVVDTQAPVISLACDSDVTIEAGESYEDAGFSANDNYDGDITDKVEADIQIDTRIVGDTTIVYSVKDSSGNEAFAERIVHVVDTTAPGIFLDGGDVYYVKKGSEYKEPGYSAVDICDGDVTDKVCIWRC